jgi:copper chaperone CopZ
VIAFFDTLSKEQKEGRPQPKPVETAPPLCSTERMRWQTALLACVAFAAIAASPARGETVRKKFTLSGVTCHEGSRAVQMAVAAVPGVENVRVMVQGNEMIVTYDPAQTSPKAITAAVHGAAPAGSSSEYDARQLDP